MRPSHPFIAVSVLGFGAIVAYSFAARTDDDSARGAAPHASQSAGFTGADKPESNRITENPHALADAGTREFASPKATSAETRAQWILNTRSADDEQRIAAIVALGGAPKAEAVPALQRVLESSRYERDRQVALRSLHTLAIRQGDDDYRIRDTFRSAIYHGDDEGVAQSAQAFLEDIEEVLAIGESHQLTR